MTVQPAGPLTLGDLIDARAVSRETHPLLVCDDQVLTYADAAERSAAVARGLMASGMAHGSRVALLYPNGPEFAVAALATARIGAIAAPLSTFSTPSELATLLAHTDIDTVLAAARYRRHDYVATVSEAVPGIDYASIPPLLTASVPALRRVYFDGDAGPVDPAWTLASLLDTGAGVDPSTVRAAQAQVHPSDRLVIVHTSGSTSEPKGVIHTHGTVISHLRVLNRLRRYGEDEILFCASPFFWIGGYAYALLATIDAGATLVCSNAADASAVLDLIERTHPTMVNGFAQAVAHLPQDPSFAGRDLSSIRRGNLYPIMTDEVRPADPELRHNMLGMTETASVCLASTDESEQPESRRGSFGQPVPGIDAKVIDPDTARPVEPGDSGELCLPGPALMDGYCGKERHQTFDRDGWYHTGDLFHVDGNHFYYFDGRRGDMIKTSGANVSPREVEAAIRDETGLVAHVFGVDDPDGGQVVAAVIRVPAGTARPDPGELAARLRGRLSAYKVPKEMLVLDDGDVPIMSSGKLDMRAIKERVGGR